MMIDFHTRTSLFSNCGSRLVVDADCCTASTAAVAAHTTAAAHTPFHIAFMLLSVLER
jgi:hypothetical protein